MTPKRPALTLDQLDTWLSSDRAPPDGMMLSDLDGFLAGLIVGPEFIHPEEWLPRVWGDPNLVEPPGPRGQRAVQAIVNRHNEIALQLLDEPAAYAPIFLRHPDGTVIPGDWAEGFLDAVKMRADAWRPLLEAERERMLLAPILVYCGDRDGNDLLPLPPEVGPEILAEGHLVIPDCVIAIREFWLPYRSAHREAQDTKKSRRSSKRQ
jgi:uncharacterized protein